MSRDSTHEYPERKDESRQIWDHNAEWWSSTIGEGNAFQTNIVNPATDRLLDLQGNEQVLEIACGNGNFARRVARLGCTVLATDFSELFLDIARRESSDQADRLSFQWLDASDEAAIAALGASRFDAAYANMALMDMALIEPLFRGIATILRPGGHFVFSVLHPSFKTSAAIPTVEQIERDGDLYHEYSVKVTGYQHLEPSRGIGIIGQPQSHIYFERPLNVLLNAGFQAGLVADGFEEPLDPRPPDPDNPFAWQNQHGIPPVVVVRLRRPECS